MTRLASKVSPIYVFVFLLTLGWIAFIWSFRFLPSEDYPLWLCAAKVFSRFIHGQSITPYKIVAWPVPNSAFVGIVGLLDLFFSPEVSGKIFLTACAVLYILGAYLLVGSFAPRRDSALLLLPMLFVFHRSVWAGELSFSFGLGFLLFAMAIALRVRRLSPLAVFSISIGLFYLHAIPYFSWLIFLGALCLFDSSRLPRVKTLIAVVPSLFLLVLYVLHREHHSGMKMDFGPISTLRKTPLFWSLFSPLHFFDPFYVSDSHWIKVAAIFFNSCSVAVVILLIGLWTWRFPTRLRRENGSVRAVPLTALIFFAIFAVFPFDAFTGVFDFNYRFLLPAFFLVLASLAPVLPSHRTVKVVIASAAALVLVFNFWHTARISRELAETYEALSQANLDPGFRDVTQNEFEPLAPVAAPNAMTGKRLLPVHESLMYFADYLRLERDWLGGNPRMFTTSFVRSTATYLPLLGEPTWRSVPPCAIVILGIQKQNREVARLLPKEYHVAEETEYLLILKFNRVQSVPAGCSE